MFRSLSAAALLLIAACSKTESTDPAADSAGATAPGTTVSDNTSATADGGSGPTASSTSSSSGSSGTDPGSSSSGGTPPVQGEISDKVDVSEVKIIVNGEGRRYLLAVPKNYDAAKAYPLVIALHGDGDNADGFLKSSKLTFATTDQAIVAFPDRVLDLFTSYYDNNDQRLVTATIIQLKKNRNIDAGKIWGFGYSKGAFMLNEMGCRKPGLFSAIAPHSGGAPQEQDDSGNVQCPDAQALPVFATMGTDDDLGGGKFEADYWADLAGCSGTQGTAPAYCEAYQGCGSPVVFCKIPNHGHFPLYDNAAIDSWNWFKSL